MGGMWFVLGAVALVAVVVAAVSVLRRPSAEDLSSVRHYHSALGTLEHLSDRTARPPAEASPPGDDPTGGAGPEPRFYRRPDAAGSSPYRADAGEAAGGRPTAPRRSRLVPPTSVSDRPELGVPLVFDDGRAQDRFHADLGAGAPRTRMDRAQRHALHSMNHRPRRGLTLTMVVVLAVVVFGVLAVVGSQRSHPKRTTGAVTPSTGHGSTGTTLPTGGSGHGTKTTQTTAPRQLVALSSTASTALYPVGPDPYRLTISTSGPCWVNATSVSTGSTLWTGTMQAGGVQVVQATGATRVELGTLAVALQVDGVPVVIPASIQSPFVLSFEPGASPSSATTTTLG
jgi:hypothetical protein